MDFIQIILTVAIVCLLGYILSYPMIKHRDKLARWTNANWSSWPWPQVILTKGVVKWILLYLLLILLIAILYLYSLGAL